ncbi:ribosomal oxygenase 1 isoform X2 [Bacillus rossius redtenbacheri]|uniref:ribosomal oxygenase 1 isoform X2 n=1 Tax=Bacillus rossius redtenbacheri TaxID=93214 RepID=UPI002FDCEDA7
MWPVYLEMAQVYPGIQSAFEVFKSKAQVAKKKKKPKGSPVAAALSEAGTRIRRRPGRSEDHSEVSNKKRKPDSLVNGIALNQETNNVNGSRVKKNKINKKLKTVQKVAKKKLKKNSSPKSRKLVNVEHESYDNSVEEPVEVPVGIVKNGDVGTRKKRKLNVTTVGIKESNAVRKKKRKVLGSEGKKKARKEAGGDSEAQLSKADSVKEGEQLFAWLIDPITPQDFFRDTWEQRPLVIRRGQPDFYRMLVSTSAIHKVLERDSVQFSKNVDVTTYRAGRRETHNPEGRAFPSVVWGHYGAGCSVRLLNPQSFHPKLHLLNATLQEYLGCFVGANAYLTPPQSQGFAPHYDDIEAFILQLEGQKQWRLYAPRTQQEVLPRFSSDNLAEEEIGRPIMEVVLSPGDLLYFPRGTIHQAHTVAAGHSLHVTLSCYQRNTWGDLLEKALPAALKYALEEDVELRRGLPRDYLSYMGSVHSDRSLAARDSFVQRLHGFVHRLVEQLPVDAAVDQLGKQFTHDALPPVLTTAEKRCSVFGDGLRMEENGKLSNRVDIQLTSRIKLLRAHILRLVVEDEDAVRVYHYADNSLEYHGHEPQFLELPLEEAPAVELLIRSYPAFLPVSALPLPADADKVLSWRVDPAPVPITCLSENFFCITEPVDIV